MRILYIDNIRDYRIYNDPIRRGVLQAIKDANTSLNVKQIADTIGFKHAKVHYHVKKLESIGAIALDYTTTLNGIVVKYYQLAFDVVNIENVEGFPEGSLRSEFLKSLNSTLQVFTDEMAQAVDYVIEAKKDGRRVFGVHVMQEDFYMDFETRSRFQAMVRDFFKDYAQPLNDKHQTVESRAMFMMYDRKLNE